VSLFTVPSVRAALVTRLTADVPAGVVVTYGHPGKQIPKRFVAVDSTEDGVTREQRTLPLRATASRTETYDLRLILWSFTADFDSTAQQTVTEDAWATVAAVDASLRAETTLGGVVTSALVTRAVDDDFLLNEGRAAQIVLTVTVNVNRA
jgi:hypothetical protein